MQDKSIPSYLLACLRAFVCGSCHSIVMLFFYVTYALLFGDQT